MRNSRKAIAISLSLAVCVLAVFLTVGGTAYASSGAGSRWDNGAAIAILGLLAMFVALRFRKKKDDRR